MIRAFTILVLTTSLLSGDIDSKMNEFFGKIGSGSNITSAEVYDSQRAGYVTGGGMVLKNRSKNTQVASLQLPSMSAGCGGIDIYTGGFSFINKRELVENLKSIGSNSIGYAFLLGLETVSPQAASGIKTLQDWANKINSMNINSCEIAATAVGSVWPKNTAAKEHICKTVGANEGIMSDYISSRQGCSGKDYDRVQDKMKNDPKYKDIIKDDYNIAWHAIKNQGKFGNDSEYCHLVLALIGTVVSNKEGFHVYPSKISDETFLQSFLNGGSLKIYKVIDKEGLELREIDYFLKPESAWFSKSKKYLEHIQKKVLTDEEINIGNIEDKNALDFITKTRLPVYKIVNIMTAYKGQECPIDLHEVADLVAMDNLLIYLREIVETIRESSLQLRKVQMYSDEIDSYIADLERTVNLIKEYEARSMQAFQRHIQVENKINQIEQKIESEISL